MEKFTDSDVENAVKFVNLVAKHAEWQCKTPELIEIFKALNWYQTQLVPKIKSGILEVVDSYDPEEDEDKSAED